MRLKYFFPIFTCSVLIVFILYQVIIPSSTASAKGRSINTAIAGIEISETKKSEIQALMSSEVSKWKTNDIIVQGTTAQIVIPSNYITFDINKTVDHYLSISSKPWYDFWSGNKNIQLPIEINVDEKVVELLKAAPLFYVDETVEAIREHASYLHEGVVLAEEVSLSKDDLERVSFEIQDVVVDGTGISTIAEALNETTILIDEQFSFLEILEEVNGHYSDETANFVASTLYSAVLQSELDIQERHSQNVLPKFLQPGIEVKINENRSQDFSFVNLTNSPFMISTVIKDAKLIVELYSFKSDYEISYYVTNKEIVEPRTIYRLTADLALGEEKVIEKGKAGLRIQVYKKIKETAGSYETEELISRDFYPPINKVVLVSSEKPEETTAGDEDEDADELDDAAVKEEDAEDNEEAEDINKEKDDVDNPESDVKYDKGGNVITSDSKG